MIANSARQASRALAAWRSGEPSRFIPELEFIGRQAGSTAGMSAAEEERWELLAGIAEHMRKSLLPQAGLGNGGESSAVCVELLEHLARPRRPETLCRGRRVVYRFSGSGLGEEAGASASPSLCSAILNSS